MSARRIAALGLVVATACGTGLSTQAEERLQAHVDAVRRAVALGDAERAERRIEALEAAVMRLRLNGDISERRAIEVLAAADDVERNLGALGEPATTPTATSTPSEQATVEPANHDVEPSDTEGDDDDEGKDKGKGKHNGHGNGFDRFHDDEDDD